MYRSNETEVGSVDSVSCRFGPQGSDATRRCRGYRDWQMINIEDCIPECSFSNQRLCDVRVCGTETPFEKVCIYITLYTGSHTGISFAICKEKHDGYEVSLCI